MEEWRDVLGYEGIYQVSSLGRVRSSPWPCHHKTAIILKQYTMANGYKQVVLYKGGIGKKYLVHRLVATAFVFNPYNQKIVNHLDGQKGNNTVENLEWASPSRNSIHACYELQNRQYNPPIKVRCVETGEIFPSLHYAALAKGVSYTNISSVLRGKLKTTGKLHWEYCE